MRSPGSSDPGASVTTSKDEQQTCRARKGPPRFEGLPKSYWGRSGTHLVASESYLKPGALLRLSLFVFITSHHFLSFMVGCTASNGTATSFSPAPRKPPTATMRATTRPDLSTRTSLISPILFSLGS